MRRGTIAGRLSGAPEVKYVGEKQTAVANFDVAVEYWDNAAREKKTEWYPVVVWGSSAEYLSRNAVPGDSVVVTGELIVETYASRKFFAEDGAPAPMKKTVIKADMNGVELHWTGRRDGQQQSRPAAQQAPAAARPNTGDIDFGNEDDIPF